MVRVIVNDTVTITVIATVRVRVSVKTWWLTKSHRMSRKLEWSTEFDISFLRCDLHTGNRTW